MCEGPPVIHSRARNITSSTRKPKSIAPSDISADRSRALLTRTVEREAALRGEALRRDLSALMADLHVTDGVDYQYDITYGFQGRDGRYAQSPAIGRLSTSNTRLNRVSPSCWEST